MNLKQIKGVGGLRKNKLTSDWTHRKQRRNEQENKFTIEADLTDAIFPIMTTLKREITNFDIYLSLPIDHRN